MKALAAPTHAGAPAQQLGGLPWPPQLAFGRPQEDDFEENCVPQEALSEAQPTCVNHVKQVYEKFKAEEISAKIADLVCPDCLRGSIDVDVIYQNIENLHKALPDHTGDWYFTGNYPTPGGYRVVHKAFLNYYEKKDCRSY